jgi:hypothetical protein
LSGITESPILEELKTISIISRVGGGSLNPETGELKVTVGWGHGKEIVMPGQGKILPRKYSEAEYASMVESAKKLGLKPSDIFDRLGETTFDVYLNEVAFWRNILYKVWNYVLGGHQVIKKSRMLSYREYEAIDRALTKKFVKLRILLGESAYSFCLRIYLTKTTNK